MVTGRIPPTFIQMKPYKKLYSIFSQSLKICRVSSIAKKSIEKKGDYKNMKLYEGMELTLKDLADWFGIKVESLWVKNRRQKKLEILYRYADYHIIYTGKDNQRIKKIVIDKVYVPTYMKNLERAEVKFAEFLSSKDYLVTGAQMGRAVHESDEILNRTIKESTSINYATRTTMLWYGKLYQKDDSGLKGYRYPVWCRYDDELDSYFILDEAEWAIINRICDEEGLNANKNLLTLCHAEFEDKQEYRASDAEETLKSMCKKVGRQKYFNILKRAKEELGFKPVMASKCINTVWRPIKREENEENVLYAEEIN